MSVIGSVRKINTGFKNVFMTPRMTATTKAAAKDVISTPGRIYAVITTARVETISRIISCIV